MIIKPKDTVYEAGQRKVNLVHSGLSFENQGDVDAARSVAADVAISKASSFLEVGTRLGLVPLHVASVPGLHRCVGVDIVEEFINIANMRMEIHQVRGLRPEYAIADMHDLPYQDGEFDYVCCMAALEHAHDPYKAMQEVCRVSNNRIYFTIDLCNTRDADKTLGHYTVNTKAADWLAMLHDDFHVNHTVFADALTIEGYRV